MKYKYPIVSTTIAAGNASDEFILWYPSAHQSERGVCTLALNLQAGSSSTNVTITANNVWGSPSTTTVAQEDDWTIMSSTAVTTTSVAKVIHLHINNVDDYDPDADGLKIKIAKTGSIELTYDGVLTRA